MGGSKLTRKEIADKYDVDYMTLTVAMQINGVTCVGKENRQALYDELEVVDALRGIFMKRAAGHRKQAQMWGDRADYIMDVYEGKGA